MNLWKLKARCMDCKHQLQYFEEKGYCTMAYESVIGRGHIRILDEEEKLEALKKLMGDYHKDNNIKIPSNFIRL